MTNKSILKRQSPNRARRPAAARRRFLGEDVQLRPGPLVRVADARLLWAATAGPTPSARSSASTSPASRPRPHPFHRAVARVLPPQLRRCPSPRKRLPAAAIPAVGRPRLACDDSRPFGGARGPPVGLPKLGRPRVHGRPRGRPRPQIPKAINHFLPATKPRPGNNLECLCSTSVVLDIRPRVELEFVTRMRIWPQVKLSSG
jgi:hypothetical protein